MGTAVETREGRVVVFEEVMDDEEEEIEEEEDECVDMDSALTPTQLIGLARIAVSH